MFTFCFVKDTFKKIECKTAITHHFPVTFICNSEVITSLMFTIIKLLCYPGYMENTNNLKFLQYHINDLKHLKILWNMT